MTQWIDKMEAARRQIEAAVWFILDDADPVPIHTVVSAADQIVLDVAAKRGIKLLAEEAFERYFKPEYHALARRQLRRFANFFKHADKDHEEKIELFTATANDVRLGLTIKSYSQLEQATPTMLAYMTWLNTINPRLFYKDEHILAQIATPLFSAGPRPAQLLFGIALVGLATKQPDRAREALQRFVTEHPDMFAELSKVLPDEVAETIKPHLIGPVPNL